MFARGLRCQGLDGNLLLMIGVSRSILLALLGICLSSSAYSAQVLALTLDEMTDASDVIVVGQIISNQAERSIYNPRRIRTRVVVRVTDSLKDRVSLGKRAVIEFFVPGGELGGFGQKVPGAPVFHSAEHVLLYLRFDERGDLQVVGLAQGCFRIHWSGRTAIATRDNVGIHYISRGPTPHGIHRPQYESKALEPLLGRIRARLAYGRTK